MKPLRARRSYVKKQMSQLPEGDSRLATYEEELTQKTKELVDLDGQVAKLFSQSLKDQSAHVKLSGERVDQCIDSAIVQLQQAKGARHDQRAAEDGIDAILADQ
eukprot:6093385-Karenia_brevis.AAC.1